MSLPSLRINILNSRERKANVLDMVDSPQPIDTWRGVLLKQFVGKKLRFMCGFSADKAIAGC
ncbi:hypothetical protein KXD40_004247 [Peronospora effusa]|uniref:Uncharacterized protein n=1 Tax=Peronospora effusa TaxID=542832 RepID=A0A3M6V7K2_9STRA|nr:hypothetical protein DD238_007973 [Peronospora effusa]UIZ28020.1 hypothetical protein KXD40_004247 [Peronospora effusa]